MKDGVSSEERLAEQRRGKKRKYGEDRWKGIAGGVD